MSLESQSPGWEWWFVAMYFFVGGTAAGAYFIASLVEFFGPERYREISKTGYYIAFPLVLITPILLIADLGRPERFWHLFFYANGGIPYINLQSALSVGSWALLVFGAMSFLSFVDNLIQDGRLKFAPFSNLYNRRPRKLYALIGSLAGFFIAGYTGVLLNTTARPFWAATDPLLGVLFIVSGASTGAAAIALVMAARRVMSTEALERLESFDRFAMIVELVLIAALVVIAGQFAAPLFGATFVLLFWGGTVLLGILIPFALSWYASRGDLAGRSTVVMLAAVLILLGGALLRIMLVSAGQV